MIAVSRRRHEHRRSRYAAWIATAATGAAVLYGATIVAQYLWGGAKEIDDDEENDDDYDDDNITDDDEEEEDVTEVLRDYLAKRDSKTCKPEDYRMPAEWEEHEGCWMGFPERLDNWSGGALDAQKNFAQVATKIAEFEKVTVCAPRGSWEFARMILPRHIRVVEMSQDDSWFRDQAPIFVVHKKREKDKIAAVCFDFNAWGEVCYDDWENDKLISKKIASIECVPCMFPKMILEGGSIHVDGEGTLMTTRECLLEPNCVNGKKRNPDMSKKDIEDRLKKYLGVEKFLWIPRGVHGDEDTNGHVDNMACFLAPGIVALHWTDDEKDPQYERSLEALKFLEASTDARGRTLKVVKVHAPRNLIRTKEECEGLATVDGTAPRSEGDLLPGSYINFYMANGAVILPQFGDKERDRMAVEVMRSVLPKRKIVPVQSREILCGGGNIHCITQQQPRAP